MSRRLGEAPSLSMATCPCALHVDLAQGGLSQTGGRFDFAIKGEGFFLIETPEGQRLTRAGSFTPNAEGELVTPDGHRLLDAGGAPVFVPPDARAVSLAADGTLVGRRRNRWPGSGLWQPVGSAAPEHMSPARRFASAGGAGARRTMPCFCRASSRQSNVEPGREKSPG